MGMALDPPARGFMEGLAGCDGTRSAVSLGEAMPRAAARLWGLAWRSAAAERYCACAFRHMMLLRCACAEAASSTLSRRSRPALSAPVEGDMSGDIMGDWGV